MLCCACSTDRVNRQTVECAVDSFGPARRWFGASVVSPHAGLIIAHDRDKIDVWRGCAAADKTVLTSTIDGPENLIVSRTGRYLFTSRSNTTVEIFDLRSARQVAHLPNCYGPGVFSPDERLAIVVCSGGIRAIGLPGGDTIAGSELRLPNSARSLAADDAFELLAIGTGTGEVVVAAIDRRDDGLTLRSLGTLGKRENQWVSGIAFLPGSGDVVSVSRNGRIDVWDTANLAAKASWQSELKWVFSVTFYEDVSRAAVFGTLTPGGFLEPAAVIVDTRTGAMQRVATRSPLQWGSYVPRLDAFLVAGGWSGPILFAAPKAQD